MYVFICDTRTYIHTHWMTLLYSKGDNERMCVIVVIMRTHTQRYSVVLVLCKLLNSGEREREGDRREE